MYTYAFSFQMKILTQILPHHKPTPTKQLNTISIVICTRTMYTVTPPYSVYHFSQLSFTGSPSISTLHILLVHSAHLRYYTMIGQTEHHITSVHKVCSSCWLSESHLLQPFDYLISMVAMEDNATSQVIHSATKVLHFEVLPQHLLHHLITRSQWYIHSNQT